MEKLTKETLSVMTKEELQELVDSLQMQLEVCQREINSMKAEAEIGKKYYEHLKSEALTLIRAVDGNDSVMLKLIDKADVETLKAIVDDYTKKGKEKFKAVSKHVEPETEDITAEALQKADYRTLIRLKERFN